MEASNNPNNQQLGDFLEGRTQEQVAASSEPSRLRQRLGVSLEEEPLAPLEAASSAATPPPKTNPQAAASLEDKLQPLPQAVVAFSEEEPPKQAAAACLEIAQTKYKRREVVYLETSQLPPQASLGVDCLEGMPSLLEVDCLEGLRRRWELEMDCLGRRLGRDRLYRRSSRWLVGCRVFSIIHTNK